MNPNAKSGNRTSIPNQNSTRFRSQLTPFLREFQHIKKTEQEETDLLYNEQEELGAIEEGQNIAQATAEEVQNTIHSHIATIVSKALKSVFLENAYEFKLRFEKKRNKTEAQIVFCRDGMEFTKPTEESGVGQIEIAAFALRLASLMLIRPKRRLLLVLDEPFKNIHGYGNRKRAAKFLMDISKEFGVQCFISTGMEWLKIGKIIDIEGD